MKKTSILITASLAAFLWFDSHRSSLGEEFKSLASAPEFTTQSPENWLNSKPLTLASLKGKVILIDFWTFDCWNCYRSFPWLNALEKQFESEEFQIIGVHTPEFEHERIAANVLKKMAEFKLHHPVVLDNDFGYWNAMNNRYWPAFYLIDKKGNLRARFIGEIHAGDSQDGKIQGMINKLLAE